MSLLDGLSPLAYVLLTYALTGLIFGLCFVLRIAGLLDAHARGGTIGFRLMILPASVILWPLLLGISSFKGTCYMIRKIQNTLSEREKKKTNLETQGETQGETHETHETQEEK